MEKIKAAYYNFIIPLFQIVFYLVGYDLMNYIAHTMGLVYSRGIAWGVSARIFAAEYVAIIVVLSILIAIFRERVLLFSLIGSIVFAVCIFDVIASYPLRGSSVLVLGIIGIFVPYFFSLKNIIFRVKPRSQ